MLEERLYRGTVEANEDHTTGNHAEVVGLSTRKRQDLLDEADKEIQEVLKKKKRKKKKNTLLPQLSACKTW